MTELLKCQDCGLIWKYPGYSHYIGCPNCGSIHQELVNHEIPCPYCKGTGKIQTNELEDDTSYDKMTRESPEWVYMVNKEAIEKLRKENDVSKKLNEYRQERRVDDAFERLKEDNKK